MFFLSEQFNRYARVVNGTYAMTQNLRANYQCDVSYGVLTKKLSKRLANLRYTIAQGTKTHEENIRDFSGWLASCTPGTNSFQIRWELAANFKNYDILAQEISVVYDRLITDKIKESAVLTKPMANRSESVSILHGNSIAGENDGMAAAHKGRGSHVTKNTDVQHWTALRYPQKVALLKTKRAALAATQTQGASLKLGL